MYIYFVILKIQQSKCKGSLVSRGKGSSDTHLENPITKGKIIGRAKRPATSGPSNVFDWSILDSCKSYDPSYSWGKTDSNFTFWRRRWRRVESENGAQRWASGKIFTVWVNFFFYLHHAIEREKEKQCNYFLNNNKQL